MDCGASHYPLVLRGVECVVADDAKEGEDGLSGLFQLFKLIKGWGVFALKRGKTV